MDLYSHGFSRARRPITMVAAAGLLTLGLTGAVGAAAPNDLIKACVDKSTKIVRISIYASPDWCESNEAYKEWNVTGPQGPQGPQGAAGARAPRARRVLPDLPDLPDRRVSPASTATGSPDLKAPPDLLVPAGADGAPGAEGPAGPAWACWRRWRSGAEGPAGPAGADGADGGDGALVPKAPPDLPAPPMTRRWR